MHWYLLSIFSLKKCKITVLFYQLLSDCECVLTETLNRVYTVACLLTKSGTHEDDIDILMGDFCAMCSHFSEIE